MRSSSEQQDHEVCIMGLIHKKFQQQMTSWLCLIYIQEEEILNPIGRRNHQGVELEIADQF